MFRRPQFDKVNPRHVLPSRHTIFIRGLPGSTDVGKVKDFFSSEAGTKCSVDFFSTSEDKKRFSVAIRFKSHDMARDMMNRFNGKNIMGYPVEITWFKDLKKARAKMFEEQRQTGSRQFFRAGYRGNFRGNSDRRGHPSSPGAYLDGGRRARTGSSSSGNGGAPGYRSGRVGRYSRSRSRSYSGSSSRSPSQSADSRSRSTSRGRRALHSGGLSTGLREYSGGQQLHTFGDRQTQRNRSRQSHSRSSSSSRSSSNNRQPVRHSENTGAPMAYRAQAVHQPLGAVEDRSPLSYEQSGRRNQRHISRSPDPSTTFSNAPAPNSEAGSSLVSGLIQLKRRSQHQPQPQIAHLPRRANRSSRGSTSSDGSAASSPRPGDGSPPIIPHRPRVAKRLHSVSPPLVAPSNVINKDRTAKHEFSPQGEEFERRSSLKRQKQKRLDQSSESPRTPSLERTDAAADLNVRTRNGERRGAAGSLQLGVASARSPLSALPHSKTDRWRAVEENEQGGDDGWSRYSSRHISGEENSIARRPQTKASLSPNVADQSSDSDSSNYIKKPTSKQRLISGANEVVGREGSNRNIAREGSRSADARSSVNADDTLNLIRKRKEDLALEYKRDCEAFTTVVRTLISKDSELESRLMSLLKEVLQERGQRCIEELRTFISENQPRSEEANDHTVEQLNTA